MPQTYLTHATFRVRARMHARAWQATATDYALTHHPPARTRRLPAAHPTSALLPPHLHGHRGRSRPPLPSRLLPGWTSPLRCPPPRFPRDTHFSLLQPDTAPPSRNPQTPCPRSPLNTARGRAPPSRPVSSPTPPDPPARALQPSPRTPTPIPVLAASPTGRSLSRAPLARCSRGAAIPPLGGAPLPPRLPRTQPRAGPLLLSPRPLGGRRYRARRTCGLWSRRRPCR